MVLLDGDQAQLEIIEIPEIDDPVHDLGIEGIAARLDGCGALLDDDARAFGSSLGLALLDAFHLHLLQGLGLLELLDLEQRLQLVDQ